MKPARASSLRCSVRRSLWLLLAAVLLMGCPERLTLREMCEQYPQLCADLNSDGWCRYQRAALIERRHHEETDPSDEGTYRLLLAWEHYRDCIQLAAEVQTPEHKAAADRMKGYLTSIHELDRLAAETGTSNNPFLLFYHWSRFSQQEALDKLIATDNRGELDNSEIQFHLATYYAKIDTAIAIRKLMHALEILPEQADYLGEILTSLSTLYFRQNNIDKAYVWLKVAQMADVDDAKPEAILNYHPFTDSQQETLDEQAKQYWKAIRKRAFLPPAN